MSATAPSSFPAASFPLSGPTPAGEALPPPEVRFAVCRLAVVPVRRFADMVSEMTTQVRFGEGVEILEENRGLWRVRLCLDGYGGWVDSRQFAAAGAGDSPPPPGSCLTDEDAGWAERIFSGIPAGETGGTDGRCPPPTGDTLRDTEGSPSPSPSRAPGAQGDRRRLLPAGTPLPDWTPDGVFKIGHETWHWRGGVHQPPRSPSLRRLLAEAERYASAPYLWGGRTLWGLDCSGLMQTLLRHQGVAVPRDCVQQIGTGGEVPGLIHARPGDLAFFDGTRDGGRHVGLVLPDGMVLHASGQVRKDALCGRGITVRETGHLSHRLTALRRVARWEEGA